MLFRLTRGSGIGGLAGMAARSTRDGVTLARPLLGLSKAELIAYCEAEDVDYVRDASNEDPRYARTRMRALLKSLSAEGLDAPALSRLARRAARIEEALERQTLAAEAHLHLIQSGACDAAKLFAEPAEIVQRLINLAIARIGKRDASRIGLEKIETLTAEMHEAWLARERFSANVAGAHVKCDAKGAVRVGEGAAAGTGAKANGVTATREHEGAPLFAKRRRFTIIGGWRYSVTGRSDMTRRSAILIASFAMGSAFPSGRFWRGPPMAPSIRSAGFASPMARRFARASTRRADSASALEAPAPERSGFCARFP